jgi:hypothetical protein
MEFNIDKMNSILDNLIFIESEFYIFYFSLNKKN